LLKDELLVWILSLSIPGILQEEIFFSCDLIVFVFGKFDQLLKQAALKIPFINNFVNQVLSKALAVLNVSVAFDNFADQLSRFNLFIQHIQEKVELRKKKALATWIFITAIVEEFYALLEQISILNFLEN